MPCFSSRRLFVLAALATLIAGCPNYTKIPEPSRAEIEAAREGQLLWLAQSLYVGQFYDDDRYELVYPRRFEELDYLRTIEGDPIPPPPAKGVIPAGTRVRIERIEWPTGDVVFARPIYTPRYTTWVYLRVGAERGPTNLERPKKHILPLPGGIPEAETFQQWFGAYLTDEDPNGWIDQLPAGIQAGVIDKHPVLGMDYDTLSAAMGYPDRLTRDTSAKGDSTIEVAVYGAASVVLKDGVVVKISDPGRGIDEAAGAAVPAAYADGEEEAAPAEAVEPPEPPESEDEAEPPAAHPHPKGTVPEDAPGGA